MRNRGGKKKLYIQSLYAAMCAMALLSIQYIIRGFYPFGSGSVMITDMYSQYVPLLYRFYDVVTGVKNLFLDLSVSGGANLYSDTVNEIVNPFNYVLFLFGRDMIYKAVNVVLLLYVGASAASVNVFLIKIFPRNRKWNLVLSLCYAMSGYMAYNYQVIKWMIFPVIFPLFCLSLYKLIKEKKGGSYALFLAYQLVLSIQLGYMALLFTLFGCGIYFYCYAKKEERGALICRLGGYTALGLLLSGAAWIPNILILLSSSRAGENLSYINIMKMHGFDDLFERVFQIAHPVLLAILAYLFYRYGKNKRTDESIGIKERKFLILLNAFLWLSVLLQPANLIWHMGSYVCFPVRYAYMEIFLLVCLIKLMLANLEAVNAAKGQDLRNAEKKKNAAVIVLMPVCSIMLCAAACALAFIWNEKIVQAFSTLAISSACPKETMQVCIILLLFFLAALCASCSSYNRQLLLCVSAVCGICFWLFIMLPQDYGARRLNEAAYRKMTEQSGDTADSVFCHVKDDPTLPPNAALVNNQSSLTGYLPTGNRSFRNTMEELGYLVPWVATKDVGGTEISDTLLSEGIIFYKNASELELKGDSPLKRQEELGILAFEESYMSRIMCSMAETDEAGAICLRAEGEQIIYLDSALTADSFSAFVNGQEVEIPEADSSYGAHRIVKLGTFSDEEVEILITDKGGSPLPVENMEIAMLDMKKWSDAVYKEQSDSARLLKNDEIAVDAVNGSIGVTIADAMEGQTVFLPTTSLRGWSCNINGNPADICNVFGFIGVETVNGRNEIILKFTPPGLFVGRILTILGIVGMVVIMYIEKYGKSKLRETSYGGYKVKNIAVKVTAVLFRILFIFALAAVYIIPAVGLAVYIVMKILKIGG